MSILDKFAEKIADAAGDPKWIDKVIDSARDELPQGDGPELTAIRDAGIYALAKLDDNKEKLAAMSERQVIAFLGRISLGKFDKAGRSYVGAKAGSRWASSHAAVDAAGDATEQSKRDYEDGVKLAKKIGSTVAKSLLPLLLTVV